MKKVAILMSTYNGEKFIKEQLDSLINQTYKDIDIYIRDDGSKDNTIKIIKSYKQKNIKLIKAKNVGVISSFKELINTIDGYDYYSFCDQDDIWDCKKIEYAVTELNKEDNSKPLLYSANIAYYDENMNFIGNQSDKKNISFVNSLIDYISPGMTMVFNDKARLLMSKSYNAKCGLHDGWIYRICSSLGKVIFDKRVVVKYRRYDGTATTTEQSLLSRISFKFKMFFLGKHWKKISKEIVYFKECFYDDLTEHDKYIVDLFSRKKTIRTQIKKIFLKEKYKAEKDFLMRIMFILWEI